MWRSFFLALGVFLCILGAECLAVQKFVLKPRRPALAAEAPAANAPAAGTKREITPQEWAPWSLLATGAIVCLYSYSIPRRMGGK